MLLSQLTNSQAYPKVHNIITSVLDMQFADVRAMLQLPRPDVGIKAGCNFAIVSSLCNLISGISTTIFKPQPLLNEVQSKYHSGPAFKEFVTSYYPSIPPNSSRFADELYNLCRNPMAHSVGIMDAAAPVVYFARFCDQAHPEIGWSDKELEDLENPSRPFQISAPSVVIENGKWTLTCDSFYIDAIRMVCKLTADKTQMQAAENRFGQRIVNWRIR